MQSLSIQTSDRSHQGQNLSRVRPQHFKFSKNSVRSRAHVSKKHKQSSTTKSRKGGSQQRMTIKSVPQHISHPLFKKACALLQSMSVLHESKEETLAYDALRNVARGMFGGDRTYEFYAASAERTIFASNVIVGSISFVRDWYADLISSNNWTALAAIFDEFTILEAEYSFVPSSAGFNVASPAPTYIAFDDDNVGVAPTSAAVMLTYPNVKMFCPAVQGATLATEANSTGFHPIKFRHSRPYPISPSPLVSGPTTGWTTTAAPSNLLGEMIMWNTNVIGSTTLCYYFIVQFKVAFRCMI